MQGVVGQLDQPQRLQRLDRVGAGGGQRRHATAHPAAFGMKGAVALAPVRGQEVAAHQSPLDLPHPIGPLALAKQHAARVELAPRQGAPACGGLGIAGEQLVQARLAGKAIGRRRHRT